MKKILFLFFVVAMVACKPAQVITLHDIQYRDRVSHDTTTITKHDSTRIYQKGDTVFSESFKTLYRDRTTVKHDSINKYVDKPVPVEKIKEVEKKLSWLQSIQIWIGKIILLAGILAGLFFGAKYLLKLRKIIP